MVAGARKLGGVEIESKNAFFTYEGFELQIARVNLAVSFTITFPDSSLIERCQKSKFSNYTLPLLIAFLILNLALVLLQCS